MRTLMDGLEILNEYDPYAELAAEHDIIIVGIEPESMKEEDRSALNDLPGWHERKDDWGYFT